MKLDAKNLRYLTKDDFRTLVAVEMGMKNHELVPVTLIGTIANLKYGGAKKSITTLHKFKLLFHDARKYDGYKLTYLGYDFLALKTLTQRGICAFVGNQIGVGKESDIYIVADDDNKEMVLKLHRLGRTSFKTIKNNRDYLKHRKSASWLYLSRLAALKEFAYMKALHDNGFPVPTPIDYNRHTIVMSRVRGYPMTQIMELRHPTKVYNDLMNLLVKLANYGLIHGDFNEFNILISDDEEITLIDFPQMVSTSHPNAEMYFDRDVNCIRTFFEKRFGFIGQKWPKLSDCENIHSLDVQIAASGFTRDLEKDFDKLAEEQKDLSDEEDIDNDLDGNQNNEDSNLDQENENQGEAGNQENDDDDDDDDEEDDDENQEGYHDIETSSDESDSDESVEDNKPVIQEFEGLSLNKNRDFKFSNLSEDYSAPVILRKEYIKEIEEIEGETQDGEFEKYIETPEERKKRKEEEKKRAITDKVKRQLNNKSKGGKMSVRNTVKSKNKRERMDHIKAYK